MHAACFHFGQNLAEVLVSPGILVQGEPFNPIGFLVKLLDKV